jgi:outer membrane immunogenic protein
MERLRSGLLACVVAAAAAPAAFAADMPLPGPAPAYAPPPPARYDWTGFYVGGHFGGGALNDSLTTTTSTAPFQAAGVQTKLSSFGVIGGAQAGVNYQFSSIVVGAEGTWTASAISGSEITPTLLTPGLGVAENSRDAPRWYATATGRVGYAANDVLLYAKGGAAWMRVDYTQQVIAAGVASAQLLSPTRHGYTIGGGIEYALTENLSVKLEYDYLNFGTQTFSFNNLTVPIFGAVGAFPLSIKSTTQMLLLAGNYRFNWGGGYAKY